MAFIRRPRGRPRLDDSDKRSKTVHVRLTNETYEYLKNLAEHNHMSVSNFARFMIEEGLDREQIHEEYDYDDY